jgi:hypothetical protein
MVSWYISSGAFPSLRESLFWNPAHQSSFLSRHGVAGFVLNVGAEPPPRFKSLYLKDVILSF